MVLKDHVKSLAGKLLDAKSQGERLRALEPAPRRARPGEEERRVLRELKRKAIEQALELLVERVLGPRWQRREEERLSPWLCHHCGSRLLSQMRRNGHYRRNLVVGEGVIALWVPQVECKGCGRSIRVEWGILERRSRYWIEIDKEVTELYMNGVSHRKVVEMLARRIQSSLSPMTSWRALHG